MARRGWGRRLASRVLVLLLLVGGVLAFTWRPLAFAAATRLTARRFPNVRWITSDSLARWLGDRDRTQPLLLDARTAEEYAVSRLRGARRIDPYIPNLTALKAFPADTPIVVYSSVGYRSARIADRLGELGLTRVWNLERSLFGWANEGRPLATDNGPAVLVHPFDRRWGCLLEARYRAEAPPLPKRSAAP